MSNRRFQDFLFSIFHQKNYGTIHYKNYNFDNYNCYSLADNLYFGNSVVVGFAVVLVPRALVACYDWEDRQLEDLECTRFFGGRISLVASFCHSKRQLHKCIEHLILDRVEIQLSHNL